MLSKPQVRDIARHSFPRLPVIVTNTSYDIPWSPIERLSKAEGWRIIIIGFIPFIQLKWELIMVLSLNIGLNCAGLGYSRWVITGNLE